MTERHAVTSLDELVAYEIPGQARWHMIRSRLDVKSFGINAWTATEDDQQVIGEHDEADGAAHEELYVVITGHATFTLDGESGRRAGRKERWYTSPTRASSAALSQAKGRRFSPWAQSPARRTPRRGAPRRDA